MDRVDVLIVGGGPAGSSCAWGLRHSGLDVAILDKQIFPRHKVCGGWITPAVLAELEIDAAEYGRGRVLQPITSFRTGSIGGSTIETIYGTPVSYGIRRCEFDDYLLRRSGARLLLGAPLTTLERRGERWIVNGEVEARMLVGAGGHFCPVARLIGAKKTREKAVVAQEAEFEMDSEQVAGCRVQPETPELYFCSDMKGYGWCFRKGNFLNVGLGRMDQHRLGEHVSGFVRFLKSADRLNFDIPSPMLGHAYLLFGSSTRDFARDGLLLIGDSAGLAYEQSGEGIRPAIESGLFAANTILTAEGKYTRERLEAYRGLLTQRFGTSGRDWTSAVGRHLPDSWIATLGRLLLCNHWFTPKVVHDRWFLHSNQPALPARGIAMASNVQNAAM
jgi:geranylgeranyl reductase family protein